MGQVVRNFNKILFCLDDYNDAFSPMVFSSVLAGSSHFSVFQMTVFKSDASVLDTAFTLICFAIFWAQLIAAAKVNKQVKIIGLQT